MTADRITVSVATAAKLLGCSATRLLRMIHAGRLRSTAALPGLPRFRYRVPLREVERLNASNRKR